MRTSFSWFREFIGVEGEDDAVGSFIRREVGGDCSSEVDLQAGLLGEVDAEGRADFVVVEGDTDEARCGPEAEGVADEAEHVGGVLDGKRIHCPVPLSVVSRDSQWWPLDGDQSADRGATNRLSEACGYSESPTADMHLVIHADP